MLQITLNQYEQLVMIECAFFSLSKLGTIQSTTDFENFLAVYEQLTKIFRLHVEEIEVSNNHFLTTHYSDT